MLNKGERNEVVKAFRIFTIIGQLPTEVDLTRCQLSSPSTRKKGISALSFIFYVLHVLYKIGSLGFAFFFVPDVPLHELLIHTIIALATSMCMFWYYMVYVRDPSLMAAYFSMTLMGNVGGSLGPEDRLKTKWTSRLRDYSLQDLIATSIPYMAVLAVLTVIAAYLYEPSLRLLLFTALPNSFQSWATFGLCLLEEIRYFMVALTAVVPIWQLQVISFDLVSNQLQRLIRKIQNGTHSARRVYGILRSLQLYVSILNSVNRYLIFSWKLVSISMCILNGYVAVAHFQDHPVFGVMSYVVLFDVALIYTIIYEKAFKIPQLFDQASTCALLHLRGDRRSIFRRQIRSIPRAGIKVGDFHTLERASTLIFFDFVLTNIVSMLVAYG